ncbi:hypothetical protein Plec18167_003501 [Paecilomyces lecythidis]|uniref:Uncharacterized protein n=1 Tax=Paecilomyces lecythidis TaxID=3004212 RepID=A0ABR3XZJ4_9EURO
MADTYDMDGGMPAPSEFGGHDDPANGPGSPGSVSGPGGPGGYEGNMTTRGGQQSSIVDPDGNYIHLMNDEGEPEVVIPIAAVYLPYSLDVAERNRRLESALHSREDQRGIGGNNPYIGDFFIPDSFRQWLMNEGRVEFIPHGGRRFVRAVPLAEAIFRFQRERRGHGRSDGEISRIAQSRTLLDVLEWLAEQGEVTYMHKWCMRTQKIRDENMRRIADRRSMGPGNFPPPSDFSPHMFAGDMSPRSPHGYGPRRRPPPPHAHGMPMPMDPEMLMHLHMGGGMPPPPPPEFYGYARGRRGSRRPGFGPPDPRFHGGGGYY